VLSAAGAGLTPILDAQEYLLAVDERESLTASSTSTIEVHAIDVDVRVVTGDRAEAYLTADLRQTFAQHVDLHVEEDEATLLVEATYREGLSWGINPSPVLVVTLPQDHLSRLTVVANEEQVDLSDLPAQLRELVRVEGS